MAALPADGPARAAAVHAGRAERTSEFDRVDAAERRRGSDARARGGHVQRRAHECVRTQTRRPGPAVAARCVPAAATAGERLREGSRAVAGRCRACRASARGAGREPGAARCVRARGDDRRRQREARRLDRTASHRALGPHAPQRERDQRACLQRDQRVVLERRHGEHAAARPVAGARGQGAAARARALAPRRRRVPHTKTPALGRRFRSSSSPTRRSRARSRRC